MAAILDPSTMSGFHAMPRHLGPAALSCPAKFELTILSPIILSMPNTSYEKEKSTPPTAYLVSFCSKDNYVITLLQYTLIFV
jgi:hypothetical protein